MKTVLVLSILFSAIALPALGELTDADLDKIRLIVNDSEKRLNLIVNDSEKRVKAEVKEEITRINTKIDGINTKIDGLDTRFRRIETDVAWTRGKIDSLDRHINWLMALIVVAIGLPQAIVVWRSRKDRTLEKQIEALTQEIETLKQQRVVNP